MGEYIDPAQTASGRFFDANRDLDYDALIIGAGFSGIHAVYRMKELGFRTTLLEAGGDVGGTWYWNRYPGARFDSESYSYGYSFSKELLDEWHWPEHFAAQPDTLAYAEYVVKKFDLRKYMQFNIRIKSMHYQNQTRSWLLTDQNGKQYTTRFVITCMGVLNEYTMPSNIPGIQDFKGISCHTARWPREGVDFRNKRVAIIGTGATGIQTIQEVVKTVGHLTVLQRSPQWSAPLHNGPITKEEMAEIRKQYPQIFKACNDSYANFVHMPCEDTRKTVEVPEEERLAFWEHLYTTRGFGKWISNYRDIGYNREANALYSKFIADKIRQRVHDPVTAEKLIPRDHGWGTKRVPLETRYFECYNQPNVRLKDIKEDPIERVTERGIKCRDEEMEFDMIIYATGFDAITGALNAVDIRGIDGLNLKDVWSDGPRTFLGLFIKGFPNLNTVMGPHQAFGNFVRSAEYAGAWVADFMAFCRDHSITYAEATQEGVEKWTEHVHDCAKGLLANEVDSWMTGVNKNLAYKQKRIVARYNGPAPGYRKKAEEVKQRNYSDLVLE